ncbi:MAG: hypothetical protein ACO1N9_00375 [Flavobacterium sp.]
MKKHVIAGLIYGMFMFIAMEIIFPLLRSREITAATLTAGAFIWGFAGIIFGYFISRQKPKTVEKQ